MMNQMELARYLQENMKSHNVVIEGNCLVGRRRINSSSFASFIIRYIKNLEGVVSLKVTSYPSRTIRYSNTPDLITAMGAFADVRY